MPVLIRHRAERSELQLEKELELIYFPILAVRLDGIDGCYVSQDQISGCSAYRIPIDIAISAIFS